ncbi:MAG TPA: DUF2232 domain-containing protein [Gemmatimonadales bacterium]|nr:DUF2232 domain-containing protein [Gemmatimonadales bacterium]
MAEAASRGWVLRLGIASVAFASWAPPSLAGLPLAGLLLLGPDRSVRAWGLAVLIGLPSAVLLATPDQDVLSALLRAYVVCAAGAFCALTLVAPAPLLRQAVRTTVVALAATLGLGRLIFGPGLADMVHWAADRAAVEPLSMVVGLRPELYPVAVEVMRFLTRIVPATLVLQTFAGLALAWQWYQHLSHEPLGAPLAPFREFRFADSWVWGVVAALGVCVTPFLVGFKAAALNLLVVLGMLYLLRGAAVVVAVAATAGIAPGALTLGLIVAAVLAAPLVLILPGLATLGVTDTWLEFRRRLPGRAPKP